MFISMFTISVWYWKHETKYVNICNTNQNNHVQLYILCLTNEHDNVKPICYLFSWRRRCHHCHSSNQNAFVVLFNYWLWNAGVFVLSTTYTIVSDDNKMCHDVPQYCDSLAYAYWLSILFNKTARSKQSF